MSYYIVLIVKLYLSPNSLSLTLVEVNNETKLENLFLSLTLIFAFAKKIILIHILKKKII